MGTFQKIINCLVDRLDLGPSSSFLDIGSGLGKPNLHVAVEPGVRVSFGVELERLRWQLSMHNLRHCMSKVRGLKKAVAAHKQNTVYFANSDITNISNFDPFTHIYMFDVGFPPSALVAIANAFNVSRTVKALVSFTRPHHIITTYGFAVQLIDKITTRMHGSSESHTAYVYRSLHNTKTANKSEEPEEMPSLLPEKRRTRSSDRLRDGPAKRARHQQLQLGRDVFTNLTRKTSKTRRDDVSVNTAETTGESNLQPKALFETDASLLRPRDLFGSSTYTADTSPNTRPAKRKRLATLVDPIFQTGFDLLAPPQDSKYKAWINESGGLLADAPRPKRAAATPQKRPAATTATAK